MPHVVSDEEYQVLQETNLTRAHLDNARQLAVHYTRTTRQLKKSIRMYHILSTVFFVLIAFYAIIILVFRK